VKPDFAGHDLDVEVVFDRFLGMDDLDLVQDVLASVAPRWCRKLRVWKAPRDQVPIDLSDPHALGSAVLAAAGERGDTYRALVEKHGRPPHARFAGSAELRGAGPELTVVISVDELVLAPLGPSYDLGNHVALQVRRAKVEADPGPEWVRAAFEALAGRLSPAWGAASHVDEYWSKVMSDEPPVRAVGRDFGRHLPGVFWLNYFGRPYVELLGARRLGSAPNATPVGDGFLIAVGHDPRAWDDPATVAVEQTVRDHLGPELFFTKGEPERVGVVPDWG
jgi:hypothetical protein